MTTRRTAYPPFLDWLAVTDANLWPDRAGSGMVVSVDSAVTWNGHPTLRLDIPALSSGTYRVGTSGATVNLPSGMHAWNGQKWLTCAMRSSNLAAVDGFSLFFGDAAFSNYYTAGFDEDNFPELEYQNNEWMIGVPTTFAVGAGAPTFSGAKRLRMNLTVTSDANPTTVWFGGVGFMPGDRAKCIVTLDDGYDEQYSFARVQAQTYGIPLSFGIDCGLAEGVGYMTRANLLALMADPLFCLVNHGKNNQGYDSIGLTAYLATLAECDAYLSALGVGQSRKHHPLVQSQFDTTLLDALRSLGYLTARAGVSTGTRYWQDKTIRLGDKRAFDMTGAASLTTGTTLANVQTYVSDAILNQRTIFLIGHRFDVAAGTDQWAEADFTSLMAWLAARKNAGLLDCLRWDEWYSGLTGGRQDSVSRRAHASRRAHSDRRAA